MSHSHENFVCQCGKISKNVVNRLKKKKKKTTHYRTGCRVCVFKSLISNFQKSCKIKTRILIDPSPSSPSCYFSAFASFFSPHQLPAFPPLYVLIIFQPLISASLMMTSVSLSLWRKPLHPSSFIVGFLPQQGALLGSLLYLDKYGFMNSYFIQRTIFL